jgi:hypothetical protein
MRDIACIHENDHAWIQVPFDGESTPAKSGPGAESASARCSAQQFIALELTANRWKIRLNPHGPQCVKAFV